MLPIKHLYLPLCDLSQSFLCFWESVNVSGDDQFCDFCSYEHLSIYQFQAVVYSLFNAAYSLLIFKRRVSLSFFLPLSCFVFFRPALKACMPPLARPDWLVWSIV